MQTLLESLRALRQRSPDARILDVGGSYAPCRAATHIVDIEPLSGLQRANAYGEGELLITPENYHQLDICAERFPFADKSFDFVICRHTLEDIRDPIAVCREMNRVGRAGYLECPSRVYESTKGVERWWWAGHYHHRWLVEVTGTKIQFQFKPHNLSASSDFHFRRWPWQKMRDRYRVVSLSWTGGFDFAERVILDYNEAKGDLRAFKRSQAGLPLFRLRWAKER